MGGLVLTALALGLRVLAVSAETDPVACQTVRASLPQLVQCGSAEHLHGSHFTGLLAKRSFGAIILGGGSPCQGNSALNSRRRGLKDVRSSQPVHLQRLKRELASITDVPILTLLENVAASPPETIDFYSELLETTPLISGIQDAAPSST